MMATAKQRHPTAMEMSTVTAMTQGTHGVDKAMRMAAQRRSEAKKEDDDSGMLWGHRGSKEVGQQERRAGDAR